MDACGGLLFLLIAAAVLGVGLGLTLYLINNQKVNKELQQAFASYRQSLELLKQQPNNPDLYQSALRWGRHYSNLTRDRSGVTLFDEMALANDLKAASAGAGQFVTDAATTSGTQPLEQRLDRLKALLDSGAIDEQEYRDRRSRLLDEI
jgi:hypothetical protein